MNNEKHRIRNALIEMDGGRVLQNFQTELERVVDEVTSRFNTKAAGSITLKIDVKRNGEEMIEILPKISVSLPAKPMRNHVLFYGDEGSLHSRSPHQGDIEDVIDISKSKDQTS